MIGPFLKAWVMNQPEILGMIGVRFRPLAESPTGGTYPYVTYFIVSDQTGMTLGGMDGLSQKRVQLDLMTKSYGQADILAGYFKGRHGAERLHGYRGTLAGVEVVACFVTNRQDLYEEPVDAANTGVYRVILDLEIWHRE